MSETPNRRSLAANSDARPSTIKSSSCPDYVIVVQVKPVIFSIALMVSRVSIVAEVLLRSNSAWAKSRLVLIFEISAIISRDL